jgi:hypothetical protein
MATHVASLPATPRFMSRVLKIDALFEIDLGALLLLGAGPLSGLFGVSAPLLAAVGAVLVVYGLWLWRLAGRPDSTAGAAIVLALNIATAGAGAAIILVGGLGLTTAGLWGVGIVADVSLIFAAVQAYALWRGRSAPSR